MGVTKCVCIHEGKGRIRKSIFPSRRRAASAVEGGGGIDSPAGVGVRERRAARIHPPHSSQPCTSYSHTSRLAAFLRHTEAFSKRSRSQRRQWDKETKSDMPRGWAAGRPPGTRHGTPCSEMVIALLRYPTTSLLAKPFHCGNNVSVRRHKLEISPVLMAAEIGIERVLKKCGFGIWHSPALLHHKPGIFK